MKKTFKRLGAMFLAMVMAVSVLCTGAFAADTTYTITINNETKDYTYAAYQVFKGDLHTNTDGKKVLSNIQWGSAVTNTSAMLNAIKDISVNGEKPFSACTDAASVANVLNGQADKSEMAKAFAKVVGDQLKNATSTNSTYVNATGSTEQDNYVAAHYTIGINDAGYYLVKNTAVPTGDSTETAYTNYILEVVGNVSVEPKVGVPTVDKKVLNQDEDSLVNAITANIGDQVAFTLTGTLPDNYDDYQSYKYVFHDTLSKGLTLEKTNYGVYVQNDNGEPTDITTSAKEHYTFTSTTGDDGKTTITVTFENLKEIEGVTINKDSKIIVEYAATLNQNAQVGSNGNDNKVYLEYSNDPNATGEGTTGKTPEDEVKVYTFQLDITKVDAQNNNTKLKNAKFVLSTKGNLNLNDIDDSGIPTNKKDLIAVSETPAKYTVNDTPNTDTAKNSYVMSTDDNGALNISGLKPNKYYLYETKAPDGYNRRTTAIPIEIKATVTKDSVTGLTINADNEKKQDSDSLKWTNGNISTGVVSATITNTAGSNLPSTGGMGTKLFYVVGGLLMAGAAIVLVIKKRRSSAE